MFAQLAPPSELFRWHIPPGDRGTEATIVAMASLIDPKEGGLVEEVGDSLRVGPGSVAARVRELLATFVRFEHDPPGLEYVRHPERMLEEIRVTGETAGDCDDIAVLGAALGLAAGLPPRFVTVATRAGGPYVHVFTELGEGGRWIELDTSRELQGIPAGWTPPRRAVWTL